MEMFSQLRRCVRWRDPRRCVPLVRLPQNLSNVSAIARRRPSDGNAKMVGSAYVGANTPIISLFQPVLRRPPQPFGELAHHVAKQQQGRGPDQRRYEIGDLEWPVRHLENAGGERHRSPQWPEEPADEDRRYAPFFHERLTARQDLGIT